jgi:CheY-like chemotaxis protein
MTKNDKKVFISYAREDYTEAFNLYSSLKENGIDVWLDTEDLLPGSKWEYEIRTAIKKSSFFIAIISKNSTNKKGYVQKELRMGLDILHEFPESQIYLIPVRLDDTLPISPILQELNWVDLFKDMDRGVTNIIRAIEHEYVQKNSQNNRLISNSDSSRKTAKILLIDERDAMQLRIQEILENGNYQVHSEYSAEQALKKFDEISPDIVLIEMYMSGMSGLEVLRKIRVEGTEIPIILFSEHEDFRTQLATWAADEFLVKSSVEDTLLIAIKRNLEKSVAKQI